MTQRATWLTSFFVLVFAATQAQAQITVVDSASVGNNSYISTANITFDFSGIDLTGADKLVATFGLQHSGLPAAGPISAVTYNGQTMTEAIGTGSNVVNESAIWYLDNPGTTPGNLVATVHRSYGVAATIWVLSGTAPGVGATASSPSASTSLTTTAAGSWVLAQTTVGGSTAPVAQSPLTAGVGTVGVYSDKYSIGTGYQTVVSPSSVTPTFDIGNMTVAAEFQYSPPAGTVIVIK